MQIPTYWYNWPVHQAKPLNLLLGQRQELQLLLLAFFKVLLDGLTGKELKRWEGMVDLHGVNTAPPRYEDG